MLSFVSVSLFFLLLSYAEGADYITTKRGAIAAIQTGPSIYELREVAWNHSTSVKDPSLLWNLFPDPNFPSEYFIHSHLYPTLVWDAEGYHAQSGAQILLWTKKTTEQDSRNQRWQWTAYHKFASVMDPNLAINVTASNGLALAPKVLSLADYQYFKVRPQGQPATLDISTTVPLCFSTSFPYQSLGCLGAGGSAVHSILTGSELYIFDSAGDVVPPSPISVYGTRTLELPQNVPWPYSTTWRGWSKKTVPQKNDTQLSFGLSDGYFSAYGYDNYGPASDWGNWWHNGTIVFTRSKWEPFERIFTGAANLACTKMSGTWRAVDGTASGEFMYYNVGPSSAVGAP